jgi:monoamine oxidase
LKTAIVIGSGFAGLSAASFLARDGWQVTVLEKHDQPGGRARRMQAAGFSFDMGPSWYWMPDVFERYFQQSSHSTSTWSKGHGIAIPEYDFILVVFPFLCNHDVLFLCRKWTCKFWMDCLSSFVCLAKSH